MAYAFCMERKILYIEFGEEVSDPVSDHLQSCDFKVLRATAKADVLPIAKRDKPDLIILAGVDSDSDETEICEGLKKNKATVGIPLLVIIDDAEKDYHYLQLGADVAICYPGPERLVAHCNALIERFKTPDVISIGALRLDGPARTVQIGSRKVAGLTPKEFDLLYFLARRAGRVIPQVKLYEKIWKTKLPSGTEGMLRTVDTHILRLRNKLNFRRWLVNVPKTGYKLVEPV